MRTGAPASLSAIDTYQLKRRTGEQGQAQLCNRRLGTLRRRCSARILQSVGPAKISKDLIRRRPRITLKKDRREYLDHLAACRKCFCHQFGSHWQRLRDIPLREGKCKVLHIMSVRLPRQCSDSQSQGCQEAEDRIVEWKPDAVYASNAESPKYAVTFPALQARGIST